MRDSYDADPQPRQVLKVDTLSKRFGGLQALSGLSFAAYTDEILGIVGPNGAGKSVLLNVITGIYPPDAGSIAFLGRELVGLKAYQIARAGVARTYQNIRLFKRMTVLENVLVAHRGHVLHPLRAILPSASRAAEIDEAMAFLDLMGLSEFADRPAGNLSYGNLRRLEIARALSGHPKLLLLDEPAAGMNEVETEQLVLAIQKSRELLEAVLLIEHDIALIRLLSDRVLVMDYGQKLTEGAAEDVFAHPKVVEAYLGVEEDERPAGIAAG